MFRNLSVLREVPSNYPKSWGWRVPNLGTYSRGEFKEYFKKNEVTIVRMELSISILTGTGFFLEDWEFGLLEFGEMFILKNWTSIFPME